MAMSILLTFSHTEKKIQISWRVLKVFQLLPSSHNYC